MGSLTQSLLSSSADKTNDAADYSKSLQESPTKPKTDTSQKPAVQKAIEGGEKKVEGGIKKVLGSFHDGGTVPKTGPYKLHEGEEVIPAKRASEYRKVYLGRKSKKD